MIRSRECNEVDSARGSGKPIPIFPRKSGPGKYCVFNQVLRGEWVPPPPKKQPKSAKTADQSVSFAHSKVFEIRDETPESNSEEKDSNSGEARVEETECDSKMSQANPKAPSAGKRKRAEEGSASNPAEYAKKAVDAIRTSVEVGKTARPLSRGLRIPIGPPRNNAGRMSSKDKPSPTKGGRPRPKHRRSEDRSKSKKSVIPPDQVRDKGKGKGAAASSDQISPVKAHQPILMYKGHPMTIDKSSLEFAIVAYSLFTHSIFPRDEKKLEGLSKTFLRSKAFHDY